MADQREHAAKLQALAIRRMVRRALVAARLPDTAHARIIDETLQDPEFTAACAELSTNTLRYYLNS